MDTQLTFINQSQAPSSNVVIFQKNTASRAGQIAVAWRVIANSVPGSSYSFVYQSTVEIAAADSFGDATATIPANNGELYRVYEADLGNQIAGAGPVVNGASIQVRNDLHIGNINVVLYRNGGTIAMKTGIAPQQKAVFQFKPTIWIGVVSQVQAGDLMNQAILSQINTELALLGIIKANIIMTGGGIGTTALPYQFRLADVVYAPEI